MPFFFRDASDEEREQILKKAATVIRAADLLNAIKVMTLGRQIDTLRMTIAELERNKADVSALVDTVLDLTRDKLRLESQAGREAFRLELLQEAFKKELDEDHRKFRKEIDAITARHGKSEESKTT